MEVDQEEVLKLAKEVDPKDFEKLADLFRQMLEEEHSARHSSRPRLTQKFTDMVDSERRAD
tara:strand:- start:3286 stop:3468 length:183 start_codon:yes stop_codon:yes gene_type:complete